MRFTGLAVLALIIMRAGGAQTVTILQPEVPGIELVGWKSPDFPAALEAVAGQQALGQLGDWLPFAIVLKNNSEQALVGYQVLWSEDTGARWTVGGISAYSLSGHLKPGEAVAFLPLYQLLGSRGEDLPTRLRQEQMTMRLAELQRAGRVTISLDSAILASGQFVGTDTKGDFAQNVAAFTAWHTVDEDVQSRLAAGESFESIATVLSQTADQATENTAKVTKDWNALERAIHARRLLRLYQNKGAQAVCDLIQKQLQVPMILVHR
jgi:hypothetical protein